MNRMLPEAAARERFFDDWVRLQRERRQEVSELFAPLPVLEASLQDDEATGISRLARHGEQLFGTVEPDAVLSTAPRVRFEREGSSYRAVVPMPNADRNRLDVVKVDDELTITTGTRRRSLKLPRRFALLPLAGARLEGPSLVVRFERPAAPSGGPPAAPDEAD